MTETSASVTAAPEHTFLPAKAVFLRYGWGRTKGYEMLATAGFPRRIGGVYRLDTLIAWEASVLAGEACDRPTSEPPSSQPTPPLPVALTLPADPMEEDDDLPRRNRTRGVKRKDAA